MGEKGGKKEGRREGGGGERGKAVVWHSLREHKSHGVCSPRQLKGLCAEEFGLWRQELSLLKELASVRHSGQRLSFQRGNRKSKGQL